MHFPVNGWCNRIGKGKSLKETETNVSLYLGFLGIAAVGSTLETDMLDLSKMSLKTALLFHILMIHIVVASSPQS